MNENTRYVTINQIKNFLAEYKDQQYGNTNITLNQLTAFVADHLAVPDEIDKAFVVKLNSNGSIISLPQDVFWKWRVTLK